MTATVSQQIEIRTRHLERSQLFIWSFPHTVTKEHQEVLLDKLGLRELGIPPKPEGLMSRHAQETLGGIAFLHQRFFCNLPGPAEVVFDTTVLKASPKLHILGPEYAVVPSRPLLQIVAKRLAGLPFKETDEPVADQ